MLVQDHRRDYSRGEGEFVLCQPYSRLLLVSSHSLCQDYNTVKLSTWNHDAMIVHVNNLLPILNDALLDSPVLVQGYCKGEVATVVDVAFPVDSDKEEGETMETFLTTKVGTLESHPVIQTLHKSLNLHTSFGVIKMLKIGSNENSEWVPLELHFGIPLADEEMNRKVCNKIQKHKLFSESNLSQYSMHSRELSLRLLDFIALYHDGELELDSSGIPYPNRDIQFDQGKLL